MTESTDMQAVLDHFLDDYRAHHAMNLRQRQVCGHIGVCRTEALGGIQVHCDRCDYDLPQYH